MSLSQNYPKGYDSVLYPGGTNVNQQTILPKIHDSGMGGNSAAYTSNKVGGGKKHGRSKSCHSKRRHSKRSTLTRRRRHRKTKRT